jgi:uncharacterized membrane protein YgcG
MSRRGTALLASAVIVAAGGGWAARQATAGSAASADTGTVPTSTTPVVRADLSTTTQVTGMLGYAGSYRVICQLSGIALTALAGPGTVVRRGQPLFEVDGTGVPLLYGARPMWRTIGYGITPGRDVYELDQNLIALGYNDYGNLTPSDTFTAATAAAIAAWQQARGLPDSGSIQLGEVEFLPGPIRVGTLSATVGAPVQPGAVIMTATSARRTIDVQLPVVQEYLVKVGDHVTVTLPDGVTTAPGTIAAIAPVAIGVSSSGSGSSGQGGSDQGSGGQGSSGQGGSGQGGSTSGGSATVDMSVVLTSPAAAGRYDQAPVEVNIVNATASNVLAVPINALVALAGGGYGVDAVSHGRQTLVAVRTGLFADTLVQVSSTGLRPGLLVEVPKP